MTSQPDFAHLVIDYIPGQWLVESKPLKLYLWPYRKHLGFHEGTTIDIALSFVEVAAPEGTWAPGSGVVPYRGRG